MAPGWATLKWGNQDNRYPPAWWSRKSSLRVKLLNSGDLLKLKVPNCSWKTTSGWIYYLCKVISLKITYGLLNKAGGWGVAPRENEMENRGSKADFKVRPKFVKEQRVNGSWCIKKPLMHLRCTWPSGHLAAQAPASLTGFERNYRIKILSNQIRFSLLRSAREFSSKSLQSSIKNPVLEVKSCTLHPWFITGFVDGEGSFIIRVKKNKKYRVGFVVEAYFSITLHEKDISILQDIQRYLGVGSIRKDQKNTVKYRVESIKDIANVIVPYFEKYPLITQKLADYLLFRDVVNLMINKEHLTKKGLNKIVSIKAVINHGLSDELQLYFSDIQPIIRPKVENKTVPHGQWMAGFTSAEGCFKVTLVKQPSRRIDRIYLQFELTQHSRDERLLESFITFFWCGMLQASSRKPSVSFSVYKFSDIYEKIIPFFKKHNIIGVKSKDFEDWCKAAEMFNAKKHLSEEGLNLFISLRSGMNSKRSI